MADIDEDPTGRAHSLLSDAQAYAVVARSILYYTLVLPIYKLLHLLVYILSPLFRIAQFLLLPLTSLLGFVLNILGIPFRLEVRTRIETVYIYVGLAVLLGLVAAISLQGIVVAISSLLGWNAADTDAVPQMPTRSAASYRASRRKKKVDTFDDMDSSDAAAAVRARGKAGGYLTSAPALKEL